jgi:pimeloyl-ACP methyl ester carboxylesterase
MPTLLRRLVARRRRCLTVTVGAALILLIIALTLRDPSPVGYYTSAAAKDRYVRAYDQAMQLMPEPQRVRDLRTSFGIVRVYRFAGGHDDQAPLLLLPGTSSGAPVWSSNLPSLLRTRSIYAIDLLGEPGMSIQDRPINSAADKAQWLHQVLDQLPEPQLYVVGLSIGGWTATNLAIHQPAKIAGLILIEPVRTVADLRAEAILRSIPAGFGWLPKSWRDSFSSWTAGGAPVTDVPEARMIEAGMHYRIKQPSPTMISKDQLSRLHLPVLVIIAGDSPMHDSAQAATVARQTLPDATVEVYPGASHAINGEHPERLAADIATFLAGRP